MSSHKGLFDEVLSDKSLNKEQMLEKVRILLRKKGIYDVLLRENEVPIGVKNSLARIERKKCVVCGDIIPLDVVLVGGKYKGQDYKVTCNVCGAVACLSCASRLNLKCPKC